ncbi:DNA-binding protein [Polaromonas sp. P1(28)-13]|nr:DNA-binding protein [Polaromonas sp. P1(28)-13]
MRQFPPLEKETRPTVTTTAAAYYLNRKPQTLRCWATYQNGPVNPRRIFGRLAWNTADLRRLLGVE